jgi:UDP-galactopyranose mutase
MAVREADVCVVGAGFAGSVCARVLAEAGKTVLLLDRRDHLGGNAHDEVDSHGILIHRYGPHIFHTNSPEVIDFLSRFTAWRPYEHRVLAHLRPVGSGTRVVVDRRRESWSERHDTPSGALVPFPINAETVRLLYGQQLDPAGMEAFFAQRRKVIEHPANSAEAVIGQIGEELYQIFYRGYTRKQWGLDPSQLDASVCRRIPVRLDGEDRYFTDRFQQMPADGYETLFTNLLDHERITVRLDHEWTQDDRERARHTVYTGPIDWFFDLCFGPLPYCSLRFEHKHLPEVDLQQPVATINEPDERVSYTRTTEFKHITGQRHSGSSLVREYPGSGSDPYYPVPAPANHELYKRYKALAERERNVTFVGRLAQYRYYNMDQVVAAALTAAKGILGG